jgi:hypothetical protein
MNVHLGLPYKKRLGDWHKISDASDYGSLSWKKSGDTCAKQIGEI